MYKLKVNEIFLSIQGESKFTGLPTIFIRLTGCNLRCTYCDTRYAYQDGKYLSEQEIINIIKKYEYKRVCITGGEPLLYDLGKLLNLLQGYKVTIETNGSIILNRTILKPNHSYVMDIKTPSSGCSDKNKYINFKVLNEDDEIKFVVANFDDYCWAKSILSTHYKNGLVTFSGIHGNINNQELINWILNDKLDARFQIQLHKHIWGEHIKGV